MASIFTKQKLMKHLTLLGLAFIFVLAVQSYTAYKERGEVMTRQIEVPADFARQFNRVIKKNRAQDLPSTPFMTPTGDKIDWPDLRGQYTLVNFWATWCPPCVVELPSLQKLQRQYDGQGLEVIAISLDTMRGHDDIQNFLENINMGDFAAYFDVDRVIQNKISMRGLPTTYLLDPNGRLTHVFEGDADWVSSGAIEFFDDILNNR